jgi:ubiquinone/menaquinone biosynthesis C-methylase UbiE
MYDIINKTDYFTGFENGLADKKDHSLKGIQDTWILSIFNDKSNWKIAEIGGGESRVAVRLVSKNEVWNIDKLEGIGQGPKAITETQNIKLIRSYIGDFDSNIPDNYFDAIFSISVVEHISDDRLLLFFQDCQRILKKGGTMAHAIDIYLQGQPRNNARIIKYRNIIESLNFKWLVPPELDEKTKFQTTYASNSDLMMANWNRLAPKLKAIRSKAQCVSIKMIARKDSDS